MVHCPTCGTAFSIAPQMLGKRVQCSKCGATFVAAESAAAPAQSPLPASPLDWPTSPASTAHNPFAAPSTIPMSPPAGESGPVGGPTDAQIRIGAAVAIPTLSLGILLSIFAVREMNLATVTIAGLGPMIVLFSIAGLVDPNVVRAVGKHGTHLPKKYKLAAAVIALVGFLLGMPLVIHQMNLGPG